MPSTLEMRSHVNSQKRSQQPSCPCCGLHADTTWALDTPPLNRNPNSQITREELDLAQHVVGEARARVERLEEAIDRLTAQHRAFQTVVAEHMSFFSPINALPDDLLVQIFLELVPSSSWAQDPNTEPPDGPWQVAAVCRRWRTAAISCSELWAELVYGYSTTPQLEAHRLEIQLQRSGTRPLRLSMLFSYHSTYFGPSVSQLVGLVEANASRFCSISYEGSRAAFAHQPLLNLLALETLSIANLSESDDISWFTEYPHTAIHYTTPLLRKLQLRDMWLSESTPFLIPWNNLVELELKEINTNAGAILDILSRTSNLTHFIVSPLTWAEPVLPIHPLQDVELPQLHRLSITFTIDDGTLDEAYAQYDAEVHEDPVDQLPRVLRHLRAPALEQLELHDVTGEDLRAVCVFLKESKPPLKDLYINTLSLATMASWATFIPLLAAVPTLEHLLLAFVDGPYIVELQTVLAAMTLPAGATGQDLAMEEDPDPLCPLLTTISFHDLTLPFSTLRSMIESRLLASEARLKTLHLSGIQWQLSREDLEACEDHPDGEIVMHRWLDHMKGYGLEYTKTKDTPPLLWSPHSGRGDG